MTQKCEKGINYNVLIFTRNGKQKKNQIIQKLAVEKYKKVAGSRCNGDFFNVLIFSFQTSH